MLRDSLIKIAHEPLVSNKQYNEIINIERATDHRRLYEYRPDDAKAELETLANAYSKIRRLTREEFDSIPLHELIFTNKMDEKMFIAQLMVQNSKFVTFPNNRNWRNPTAIIRTKNIVDQKGIGGINFGTKCWTDVRHNGRQDFAQVKYWYNGYVFLLRIDPRDDFDWEHNKHSYQDDWLAHIKNMFVEFGHGHRFKKQNTSEHALNYESFRSHVGVHVIESIPSMFEIENDESIAAECERLYEKYTRRRARLINIDDLSARLSTDENLEELINKLPNNFCSEFYTIKRYQMTSAEMQRSWNRPNPDWNGYTEDAYKRERINKLFKIHVLPELKKFVAKYGGNSYESSITKLVEEHIQLFKISDVDKIVQEIVTETEPSVTIYNTIVALK